jgi:hypothetical protein
MTEIVSIRCDGCGKIVTNEPRIALASDLSSPLRSPLMATRHFCDLDCVQLWGVERFNQSAKL